MKESRLRIELGDITAYAVDAIVNAANSSLRGGGGVDGAIHRKAGPALKECCLTLGGCPTGEARITPGFNLPARYVIHTVGPVWNGGFRGEAEKLAACYRNSLRLAVEHDLRTIAFASISTGVYGYPIELAARVALTTLLGELELTPSIESVTMVCFTEEVLRIHRDTLASLSTVARGG